MESKNTDFSYLLKKARKKHELTKKEIMELLKAEGDDFDRLCNAADQVREEYVGDKVYLRGIIEFSNHCKQNCHYCGLRKDNQELKRYKLTPDEIIEMAVKANQLGYKTIVLQSGEDEYPTDDISKIISQIKEKTDAAITLCLGERSFAEYKEWYDIGADRYLLKHETVDPKLYYKLHPEMSYNNRIESLFELKKIGYQVGSGNMVGLPGQTLSTLAEDIDLFKKLDLDMVGIGPFVPHPQTPLAESKAGTLNMTLKTLAVTRLLLPLAHLPATTALGTIDDMGRQKALMAGANVVMPNVTRGEYREHYEIYPDKICVNEEPDDCRQCIGGIITSLGRIPANEHGHSLKK